MMYIDTIRLEVKTEMIHGSKPTGHERDREHLSLHGSHRSCFTDKKQWVGQPFTERQQRIIDGKYVKNIRKWDIVMIINKAESLGQFDTAEDIYNRFGYFFHEMHPGDPSYEEALSILDDLTPDDLK